MVGKHDVIFYRLKKNAPYPFFKVKLLIEKFDIKLPKVFCANEEDKIWVPV